MQGYRLLVKADAVETVTESGIILAIDEKLEASGQQFGTVIDIGSTCWCNEKEEPNTPWCAVGNKILFSKYAGRFVYDPEDNEEYFIINDVDVLAVITEKDK